jgi:BirA family biotin operon repressor/biotin-[acetyl-CoA-carboxylase] ligase
MVASIALARAFFGLYGLSAGIKWPNDLLVGDRKICGILTELNAEVDRLNYAVLGLGINANIDISAFPEEWKSTSLAHEMKGKIARVELIRRILQEMEIAYEQMFSVEIIEEWRSRSVTIGRQIRIISANGDLSGQAIDLEEDGALLLKTENDIKRVLAGDCVHLRAVDET